MGVIFTLGQAISLQFWQTLVGLSPGEHGTVQQLRHTAPAGVAMATTNAADATNMRGARMASALLSRTRAAPDLNEG